MKTHFYLFTGQATPVPVIVLTAFGVPAITMAALIHFAARSQVTILGKDGRNA